MEQRKLVTGRINLVGGRDLKGTKRTNRSNLKVGKLSRALRRKVQEQSKALNTGKEKAELYISLDLDIECVVMLVQQMAASIHLPQPVELVKASVVSDGLLLRPFTAENQQGDRREHKYYIFTMN